MGSLAKIERLTRGFLLIGWLMVLSVPAGAATDDTEPGIDEADREALDAQLDDARQRLDAAARELGELHRKMYAMEVGRHRTQPMLGVLIGGRGDTGGLKLIGVTPGSGADDAGLKAGDELTSINNVDLTTVGEPMRALKDALAGVAPGDMVSVGYQRDGSFALADVTTDAKGIYIMHMGGMPNMDVRVDGIKALESLEIPDIATDVKWSDLPDKVGPGAGPRVGAFVQRAVRIGGGLRLQDADPDLARYFGVDKGVLVVEVPESEDGFPLKGGDIIQSIDGEPIADAGDAYRSLFSADAVASVGVLRQGIQTTIELDPARLNQRRPRTIMFRNGDVTSEGDASPVVTPNLQ
jgi:membrane-associated protease RseP (regulator of RpoE activity)